LLDAKALRVRRVRGEYATAAAAPVSAAPELVSTLNSGPRSEWRRRATRAHTASSARLPRINLSSFAAGSSSVTAAANEGGAGLQACDPADVHSVECRQQLLGRGELCAQQRASTHRGQSSRSQFGQEPPFARAALASTACEGDDDVTRTSRRWPGSLFTADLVTQMSQRRCVSRAGHLDGL